MTTDEIVELVFFVPVVLYGAMTPARPAWVRLSSGVVGGYLLVKLGRKLVDLRHPFLP